jgi:TetR/AcrR family transcriptional regulator, ethionamide resistance regulator
MSIPGCYGVDMALDSSRRTQRQRAAGPRKGDIRESQILDALEHLLAVKPFVELTMDDIARQAGLSRSALYFYFASKEAALSALHQRTYEAMARTTDPLTETGEASEAAMHDAVEQVVANWRHHHHALRTFHETAMVSAEFGEQWRARLGRHVTVLTGLIEQARADGWAAPGPPTAEAIASAWFWMLEAQCYELFRRPHARAEEKALVATLTTLWLRALGPTPTQP